MAKHTIVRVQEVDTEGDVALYLMRLDKLHPGEEWITVVASDGFTLEELADYCDQEAENRNNHGFAGTHTVLADLLKGRLLPEQVTAIMLDIAERGGLDGMSGMD